MKSRLRRGIVAAVLGLVVVLPVAVPAYATDVPPPPPPEEDYTEYWNIGIDVLRSLLDKGSDGALTPAEVAALVQELIGAVNGVRVDLVSRLDTELVNELRGKTATATTSVAYLRYPHTAAVYLGIVSPAAHSAKAHVDTVSSDADLDAVGRAMISLYTSLEVTEVKLGVFDPRTRYADYRQGLENLVRKTQPDCAWGGIPDAGSVSYTCEYNGRTIRASQRLVGVGAEWSINGSAYVAGAIDRAVVERYVMAGTARELAEDALEELTRKGY